MHRTHLENINTTGAYLPNVISSSYHPNNLINTKYSIKYFQLWYIVLMTITTRHSRRSSNEPLGMNWYTRQGSSPPTLNPNNGNMLSWRHEFKIRSSLSDCSSCAWLFSGGAAPLWIKKNKLNKYNSNLY